MDASKLSNWIPILQHPEHGAAICEAAGVYACIAPDGATVIELVQSYAPPIYFYYWHESVLPGGVCAALAFGTLAVMYEFAGSDAESPACEAWEQIWGGYGEPLNPSVILDAAYRWLGIGGDSSKPTSSSTASTRSPTTSASREAAERAKALDELSDLDQELGFQ